MIREILTLYVINVAVQYYIDFDKDRRQFNFQPTLTNTSAPSFTIVVRYGEMMVMEEGIDEALVEQAKNKIREILDNPLFGQL